MSAAGDDVRSALRAESGGLDPLVIASWRRRVAEMYARVRAAADPGAAWDGWRTERDALFATHPASPLPADVRAKAAAVLPYHPYDPAMRVVARVVAAEVRAVDLPSAAGGLHGAVRFARAEFELRGGAHALDLLWLTGYGGGLFVPFADLTNSRSTYGGGRYLLDTVKGADLGGDGERLVLDFNFAYNPSCAYDPRWACPLAAPGSRLDVAVEAGERHPGPG